MKTTAVDGFRKKKFLGHKNSHRIQLKKQNNKKIKREREKKTRQKTQKQSTIMIVETPSSRDKSLRKKDFLRKSFGGRAYEN